MVHWNMSLPTDGSKANLLEYLLKAKEALIARKCDRVTEPFTRETYSLDGLTELNRRIASMVV